MHPTRNINHYIVLSDNKIIFMAHIDRFDGSDALHLVFFSDDILQNKIIKESYQEKKTTNLRHCVMLVELRDGVRTNVVAEFFSRLDCFLHKPLQCNKDERKS
jgi:hypothetical protein